MQTAFDLDDDDDDGDDMMMMIISVMMMMMMMIQVQRPVLEFSELFRIDTSFVIFSQLSKF